MSSDMFMSDTWIDTIYKWYCLLLKVAVIFSARFAFYM